MALSATKKKVAYDDKEGSGSTDIIKRLSLAQATPDNIRTTSLKVDNDTRPYSTPNAYYNVNAVSPVITSGIGTATNSLDADIEKAKQRAAEKSTSTVSTPTVGAMVGATLGVTNPINGVENNVVTNKGTGKGTETISEIQAKYQGSGSGSSGYSGINGVDADIYNQIMTPYQKSQNVIDAENYLNQLRENFSGRTRYSDQLDALIGDYQNRDKFSYDPNSDMLYQNYLAAMQNNGLQAMKDTMGQASALTGGYGSTYATAAANGAYNNYLQTANDNLANFYNNALDAYNLEGQAMLNNINLLQDLDSTEYNRALQDYQMALTNADTAYERDYNNWQNSVANALNVAGYQNSDAWKQASMDADEKQRQEDLAYKQLQLALSQAPETETLSDYEKEMQALKLEEQKIKNGTLQTEWDTMRGIDSNGNTLVQSSSNSSTFSNSDMNTWKKQALEAYNVNGEDGLYAFLEGLNKYGLTDEDWKLITSYVESNSKPTYTKTENHWGKKKDKYTDSWGNEYTYAELVKRFGEEEAERIRKSV